jgi:hypothetical protein
VTISTPLFNAWLKMASRRLAPRGRKADLARHLAAQYGRPARSWERHLAAILNGERLPNAEIYIAMDRWIAKL